jgi:hypothetical protein
MAPTLDKHANRALHRDGLVLRRARRFRVLTLLLFDAVSPPHELSLCFSFASLKIAWLRFWAMGETAHFNLMIQAKSEKSDEAGSHNACSRFRLKIRGQNPMDALPKIHKINPPSCL